jgi:hypothetical protein
MKSCGYGPRPSPARRRELARPAFVKQPPSRSSSPGLTGRSSIQRCSCSNREAAAYWVPRLGRGMTRREAQLLGLAARNASEVCSFVPPSRKRRAQGMPDARCTRGRLCSKKAQALATKGTPQQPAFPARWFYGLYVISSGTGLFCPRRLRFVSTSLAPASGRRDHTISPSAKAARTSAPSPRPSHPAPNVRDDREAPLV